MSTRRGILRHPGPACAVVLGLGTLLAIIGAGGGSSQADTTRLATVDGRIVIGLPLGIPLATVPVPLTVSQYNVPETSAAPMSEASIASGSGGTRIWGYEAAQNSA